MYICVPFPLTQTASSTNNKSDESVVIEKVSILYSYVFLIYVIIMVTEKGVHDCLFLLFRLQA